MIELVRLSLDHRLSRASAARQTALAVAGLVGLSEEQARDLELAVGEAVGNALAYGDRSCVDVRFVQGGDALIVDILGNSRRFPLAENNRMPDLEAERGRGLAMIRRLVDRAGYVSVAGGVALRLEKNLSRAPE